MCVLGQREEWKESGCWMDVWEEGHDEKEVHVLAWRITPAQVETEGEKIRNRSQPAHLHVRPNGLLLYIVYML